MSPKPQTPAQQEYRKKQKSNNLLKRIERAKQGKNFNDGLNQIGLRKSDFTNYIW